MDSRYAPPPMSVSTLSRSKLRVGIGIVVVVLVTGVAFAGASIVRGREATSARSSAAADLAAFQRCLVGEPLAAGETLAGRMRGIELAVALAHDSGPIRLDVPHNDATDDDDDDPTGVRAVHPGQEAYYELRRRRIERAQRPDAGVDAAPPPPAPEPPPGETWPNRCALLSEKVRHTLDGDALRRDRTLDALRDALPTTSRLEMPYALTAAEAADLGDAIALAKLPAPSSPPENTPAPEALAVPLPGSVLAVMSKGSPFHDGPDFRGDVTDSVTTSALHFLVHSNDAVRLCALAADDPRGAYATAKCGDLPGWVDARREGIPRFVDGEDGSPTALVVSKKKSDDARYALIGFFPGGLKVASMSASPDPSGVFVSKTGDFMMSGNYGAFIRTGSLERSKTDSPDAPVGATDSVRALPVAPSTTTAAYGHVFYYDESTSKTVARRVLPKLGPPIEVTGSGFSVDLASACQSEGRTALLTRDAAISDDKLSRKLIVSESEESFVAVDAEVSPAGPLGPSPHLVCTREAAIVTSVTAKDAQHVVVIESRCTAKGCSTKRSEPVEIMGGHEADAASLEGSIVLIWKLRPDRVLSRAKGMAFYRFAPIDSLASTPPRPLVENKRGGGIDIDHLRLVSRPEAAVVVLETGGKATVAEVVRIDAKGAPSAVAVEETKW